MCTRRPSGKVPAPASPRTCAAAPHSCPPAAPHVPPRAPTHLGNLILLLTARCLLWCPAVPTCAPCTPTAPAHGSSIAAHLEPLTGPKQALKLGGVGPFIVRKLRPLFAAEGTPPATKPGGSSTPRVHGLGDVKGSGGGGGGHDWGGGRGLHGGGDAAPPLARSSSAPAASPAKAKRTAPAKSYTPQFRKGGRHAGSGVVLAQV